MLTFPAAVRRRFEAIVFDWDGTAVPDRHADTTDLRRVLEQLCTHGMHVAIVSGTHLGNVDGQLGARPAGPGTLLLALNRGSEVYVVDRDGPHLLDGRVATTAEDHALDTAAVAARHAFAARGLRTELVSTRLNRRKIDLIPEPDWHDPPKADIDRLLDAVTARLHAAGIEGLREAVAIAQASAREAGLADARVTSDAKHVEIGLTDKSDSARWLLGFLQREGVAPGTVLIGGDEFGPLGGVPGSDSLMLVAEAARATVVSVGKEPAGGLDPVVLLGGGPPRFGALLLDQLERRRRGALPEADEDPAWTIAFDGDAERERAVHALLTLADGRLGTRGPSLVSSATAPPAVYAAGLYDGEGPETTLLACPVWHQAPHPSTSEATLRQVLDLRTFVVHETSNDAATIHRAVRLSSVTRPGAVALRAECARGAGSACPPLLAPTDGRAAEEGSTDGTAWMRIAASEGGVTAAASQRVYPAHRDVEVLERLGVYAADPVQLPAPDAARGRLVDLEQAGFEHLFHEHRRTWAARWEDAYLGIEGDPELERSARFALGHVLACAPDDGEAAVGARGLTGPAYRGHVFWDADVFVLPVLAATRPAAARAILEYRVRRLDAARAAAGAEGHAGARFPWESARTGRDVTPQSASDRTGRVVPIRTGALEVHVVGCVAWAAAHYVDWTGDRDFAAGAGARLLAETARYWASRARRTPDGRAHLYGVIGPDEYHEPVDDNAFTNVLARWNLRRAAALDTDAITATERDEWRRVADALVDGYDPATGRYEQFAGFDGLEPLMIADVSPRRPIAADLLLGPERVRAAQVVKQADVLMLHHLLPGEVAAGSLTQNLDYYEPRTAHGSSLSPGVHAALLARAGRLDAARELLGLTARIDLDDLTDTTAGGLHLAAMASVWHALAFGFLGIRPHADHIELDPRVPSDWSALELRFRHHGRRITIRAEPERLIASADGPVSIVIGGQRYRVDTSGLRLMLRGSGHWRPTAQLNEEAV
ncbi:MAG: glycosyl hydrolase family 65 protein [Acidimicrobiia bacterium]